MFPVSAQKHAIVVAERDNAIGEKTALQVALDAIAEKLGCPVSDITTKIDALMQSVSELEGTDLNELVNTNETLSTNLEDANLQVQQANSQIDTLNASISEKDQKIAAMQATINRLNNKPGEETAIIVTQGDTTSDNSHANLRAFCEKNEDDIMAVLAKIEASGLYS